MKNSLPCTSFKELLELSNSLNTAKLDDYWVDSNFPDFIIARRDDGNFPEAIQNAIHKTICRIGSIINLHLNSSNSFFSYETKDSKKLTYNSDSLLLSDCEDSPPANRTLSKFIPDLINSHPELLDELKHLPSHSTFLQNENLCHCCGEVYSHDFSSTIDNFSPPCSLSTNSTAYTLSPLYTYESSHEKITSLKSLNEVSNSLNLPKLLENDKNMNYHSNKTPSTNSSYTSSFDLYNSNNSYSSTTISGILSDKPSIKSPSDHNFFHDISKLLNLIFAPSKVSQSFIYEQISELYNILIRLCIFFFEKLKFPTSTLISVLSGASYLFWKIYINFALKLLNSKLFENNLKCQIDYYKSNALNSNSKPFPDQINTTLEYHFHLENISQTYKNLDRSFNKYQSRNSNTFSCINEGFPLDFTFSKIENIESLYFCPYNLETSLLSGLSLGKQSSFHTLLIISIYFAMIWIEDKPLSLKSLISESQLHLYFSSEFETSSLLTAFRSLQQNINNILDILSFNISIKPEIINFSSKNIQKSEQIFPSPALFQTLLTEPNTISPLNTPLGEFCKFCQLRLGNSNSQKFFNFTRFLRKTNHDTARVENSCTHNFSIDLNSKKSTSHLSSFAPKWLTSLFFEPFDSLLSKTPLSSKHLIKSKGNSSTNHQLNNLKYLSKPKPRINKASSINDMFDSTLPHSFIPTSFTTPCYNKTHTHQYSPYLNRRIEMHEISKPIHNLKDRISPNLSNNMYECFNFESDFNDNFDPLEAI